ncbi:hypothetical protein TNCV_4610351 [Trichonephila clavipes]|nr:hypothetical protein TNCV_4610351 [Trichonephila clavipes]
MKNTVRPNMDKGENSDLNVRVQFDTHAAAVLKEPTSKSVETAIAPDSQNVLYPSENEKIRFEQMVDIELVERAEQAETESLD